MPTRDADADDENPARAVAFARKTTAHTNTHKHKRKHTSTTPSKPRSLERQPRQTKQEQQERARARPPPYRPSAMSTAVAPLPELGQLHTAKLVLLGEMGAGKSSLVLRFVKGQFFDYQVRFAGTPAPSSLSSLLSLPPPLSLYPCPLSSLSSPPVAVDTRSAAPHGDEGCEGQMLHACPATRKNEPPPPNHHSLTFSSLFLPLHATTQTRRRPPSARPSSPRRCRSSTSSSRFGEASKRV
jgi:hypothetical protein